jgi:hypothetical protein
MTRFFSFFHNGQRARKFRRKSNVFIQKLGTLISELRVNRILEAFDSHNTTRTSVLKLGG